jgi:general stress protein 26
MTDSSQLYDFMNQHSLMVVSSLGANGEPQSAVVGFAQTQNLEIIFRTKQENRKTHNIMNDSRVSIVIGWDKDGTVQYEGDARLLTAENADVYTKALFAKLPFTAQQKDEPNERYFVVTPRWIRYTDITTKPWTVTEIKL